MSRKAYRPGLPMLICPLGLLVLPIPLSQAQFGDAELPALESQRLFFTPEQRRRQFDSEAMADQLQSVAASEGALLESEASASAAGETGQATTGTVSTDVSGSSRNHDPELLAGVDTASAVASDASLTKRRTAGSIASSPSAEAAPQMVFDAVVGHAEGFRLVVNGRPCVPLSLEEGHRQDKAIRVECPAWEDSEHELSYQRDIGKLQLWRQEVLLETLQPGESF